VGGRLIVEGHDYDDALAFYREALEPTKSSRSTPWTASTWRSSTFQITVLQELVASEPRSRGNSLH
jgi:hypothetical protein